MSTFAGAYITENRIYDNPGDPDNSDSRVALPMTTTEGVFDPDTGASLADIFGDLALNLPVTETQKGLMTPAMLLKLIGIEYGATRFIHPSTHPAAMIVESAQRRFVSDAWLARINGFLDGGLETTLSELVERISHIEWQLVLFGILDGGDNVIVDDIDSADAVILVSGQFANGRIFI